MAEVLVWWLVVQILGLAALPVAWRLFASLPDRGYAFAKPLGIFLTSYVLWILAIFGIVKNTRGTIFFVVFAVAILSWWWATRRAAAVSEPSSEQAVAKGHRLSAASGKGKARKARSSRAPATLPDILSWLRANWRIIAVEEAIFLTGLVVWAIFKAYNPEILATEKPMELAFLNGILRSEQFPPLDPWLSGFSISYYYMGYLMMAVLTRLSGLAPTVAFNLTLVLNFALTLSGAFSVVYNLIARRGQAGDDTVQPTGRQSWAAVAGGMLASFFVAIMGNLQGFLEFFYIRGIGSPAFWNAVGIADMTQPYVSPAWYPTTNWWWWKASRVIGTQGPIGDYTINEFPFFSFMLGDNHPHVLALPYTLMAIGLALSILLAPRLDLQALLKEKQWSRLAGVWLLPALLLGGLFFLNAWDFPTCMVIVVLAYTLRIYRQHGKLDIDALKEMALFAAPIAVLAVALYLPFYMSFQSQANGFGVVRVRSQLHHFLIIFAPFLFIVAGFLAVKIQEWRSWDAGARQPARSFLLPLLIVGLAVGLVMIALQFWTAVTTLLMASIGGVLVSLMLVAFIIVGLFTLIAHLRGDASDVFVFILAGVACGVALLPEWIYINDNFGGNLARMNTVFKFLYQSWILFSLASAYSLYYAIPHRPAGARLGFGIPRLAYVVAACALILAGTLYPVMAFYTKADGFKGTPTLDGMAYMKSSSPGDYDAIQWINQNIRGAPVIVEAIGGEYSEYARISTHTGLPAVLGWPGHEVQWRGNAQGWEAREGDVGRLYATTDVNEAKSLLRKYSVTYVYVGRLERDTSAPGGQAKNSATALGKFATFMDVAYQRGDVTIYRTRE